MVTYGGTAIPSDEITVISGGTISVSVAFDNTVGLVGGMDTANGTATPGELTEVDGPTDAENLFGADSELAEQSALAFQNGAGEVWALPVSETTETETYTSTSNGVLTNVPAFDPNVQDEHEITAQDTTEAASVDVNIVYGTPSSPSESNTINLNPVTGEWEADASSDYEITYDYGDYSSSVLDKVVAKSPRIIGLLTENESVQNDLVTLVNDRATDFDFMQIVSAANPVPDPDDSSTYASGYTDSFDERRLSLHSPSRGYRDSAETNQQRLTGAIAGELASIALGLTSTNNTIGGFASLRVGYAESSAGDLIDSEVLPVLDRDGGTIAMDKTTSQTEKFGRIAWMQSVDEVTIASHTISQNYIGEQMTGTALNNLERSHINALKAMANDSPTLLADFEVSVTQDDANANQANVELGIQPVPYVDYVKVTMTVGDIIRSNGAN